MKRPAFQFYTKDWKGNLKLRRCTDAAKGAWIEILCVLHDSEEYGVVRFPLKELVAAAGVQLKSAKELVEKGVLKGGDRDVPPYRFAPSHAGKRGPEVTLLEPSDGPMWYSSRFVRDEYKRQNAGVDTRFGKTIPSGGDPPRSTPSRRDGGQQGDGSAVAVASAVDSLNQHQRLVAGEDLPPVDKPARAKPGRSNPAAPKGTSDYEARVKAEGKGYGIEPGSGETLEAYASRVRAERDKRKHHTERGQHA